jgi:hydroxymethylbilane synthase
VRRSRKPIVIASRPSQLAQTQANLVGRALAKLHPTLTVRYEWITSRGDQITDRPLSAVGGKGLFCKAVEAALLDGRADIAVHSMKDLPCDPTEATAGLTVAAVPVRSDVRDALITPADADLLKAGSASPNGHTPLADAEHLDRLDDHATVGTSSPRRTAQLLAARPTVRVAMMRGNVDTRLRLVMDPEGSRRFDAALLAAAGLRRLGFRGLLKRALPVDVMLPAPGQGALAIQCRTGDHVTLTRCLPLNDPTTAAAVAAERQLVAQLGADCHSPIAVLVQPVPDAAPGPRDHALRLRAGIWSARGDRRAWADLTAPAGDLHRAVKQAAQTLRDQNAPALLDHARRQSHTLQPTP